MILSKSQANAVFNALAEINSVSLGNSMCISFASQCRKSINDYEMITIREELGGAFLVTLGGGLMQHERERYTSYSSFFEAYKNFYELS